jgi:hypothetical protein
MEGFSIFWYLLLFLSSVVYNFLKMYLASFVKFIPRYFIVFEAIVNGILSLISFSVCALLIYRKATDFYMLILPKEFMISHSFLTEFWGLLGIGLCRLQTDIGCLLISLIEPLLFTALILLLWLEILKLFQTGVEKADSSVLFLMLMGTVSDFLHLV